MRPDYGMACVIHQCVVVSPNKPHTIVGVYLIQSKLLLNSYAARVIID